MGGGPIIIGEGNQPPFEEPPPENDPAAPPKPGLHAAIPRELKGLWVFDPDTSAIPGLGNVEFSKDALIQIDGDGKFLAAAPALLARMANTAIPDLAVAIKIAVKGWLEVDSAPNADGHYPASIKDIQIVEDQYLLTGLGGKGGDISAVAAPHVRDVVNGMGGGGLLFLTDDHDDRFLTFKGGGGTHVFKRRTVNAKLASIRWVNDHKTMHKPTGWNTPADVKPTDYRDRGAPVTGPHWDRDMTFASSYTQGETVVAEIGLTVSPAGRQFRLIGITRPDCPEMSFESAIVTSAGAPQNIIVQAKGALPKAVTRLSETIKWHVQCVDGDEAWANLGTSGPHVLYMTVGKPSVVTQRGKANHPTVLRQHFATSAVFPALQAPNPLDTTLLWQLLRDHIRGNEELGGIFPDSAADKAPKLSPEEQALRLSQEPDDIWAMLDNAVIEPGKNPEFVLLLEQCMGLLGIVGSDVNR